MNLRPTNAGPPASGVLTLTSTGHVTGACRPIVRHYQTLSEDAPSAFQPCTDAALVTLSEDGVRTDLLWRAALAGSNGPPKHTHHRSAVNQGRFTPAAGSGFTQPHSHAPRIKLSQKSRAEFAVAEISRGICGT